MTCSWSYLAALNRTAAIRQADFPSRRRFMTSEVCGWRCWGPPLVSARPLGPFMMFTWVIGEHFEIYGASMQIHPPPPPAPRPPGGESRVCIPVPVGVLPESVRALPIRTSRPRLAESQGFPLAAEAFILLRRGAGITRCLIIMSTYRGRLGHFQTLGGAASYVFCLMQTGQADINLTIVVLI